MLPSFSDAASRWTSQRVDTKHLNLTRWILPQCNIQRALTCEISIKFFCPFFIQRLLNRVWCDSITIVIENLYRAKWITMETCVCASCRCHIRHLLHCVPRLAHSIAILYSILWSCDDRRIIIVAPRPWSFIFHRHFVEHSSIQLPCLVWSRGFAWFFFYFNPPVFKWSDNFLIARYLYFIS